MASRVGSWKVALLPTFLRFGVRTSFLLEDSYPNDKDGWKKTVALNDVVMTFC